VAAMGDRQVIGTPRCDLPPMDSKTPPSRPVLFLNFNSTTYAPAGNEDYGIFTCTAAAFNGPFSMRPFIYNDGVLTAAPNAIAVLSDEWTTRPCYYCGIRVGYRERYNGSNDDMKRYVDSILARSTICGYHDTFDSQNLYSWFENATKDALQTAKGMIPCYFVTSRLQQVAYICNGEDKGMYSMTDHAIDAAENRRVTLTEKLAINRLHRSGDVLYNGTAFHGVRRAGSSILRAPPHVMAAFALTPEGHVKITTVFPSHYGKINYEPMAYPNIYIAKASRSMVNSYYPTLSRLLAQHVLICVDPRATVADIVKNVRDTLRLDINNCGCRVIWLNERVSVFDLASSITLPPVNYGAELAPYINRVVRPCYVCKRVRASPFPCHGSECPYLGLCASFDGTYGHDAWQKYLTSIDARPLMGDLGDGIIAQPCEGSVPYSPSDECSGIVKIKWDARCQVASNMHICLQPVRSAIRISGDPFGVRRACELCCSILCHSGITYDSRELRPQDRYYKVSHQMYVDLYRSQDVAVVSRSAQLDPTLDRDADRFINTEPIKVAVSYGWPATSNYYGHAHSSDRIVADPYILVDAIPYDRTRHAYIQNMHKFYQLYYMRQHYQFTRFVTKNHLYTKILAIGLKRHLNSFIFKQIRDPDVHSAINREWGYTVDSVGGELVVILLNENNDPVFDLAIGSDMYTSSLAAKGYFVKIRIRASKYDVFSPTKFNLWQTELFFNSI